MSGLIKSGQVLELASVRPLSAVHTITPVVTKSDEERERLRHRVATLEGEMVAQNATIDALKADVVRAFDAGKRKGREEGLAEAKDRADERLALLRQALQNATATLAERLAGLERLAPLLALECLDKILGDSAQRRALVAMIIQAQLKLIDRAMLLRIEVSRSDFPQTDLLARLQSDGLAAVEVKADPALPSGSCVLTLRLGRMEVGLNQQWGVLRDLLRDMAADGEAR